MLGAIAGDIIGSVYEYHGIKTTKFPLFKPDSTFTDDTVLSVAVAHAIMSDRNYKVSLRQFGNQFPNAGYGPMFIHWILAEDSQPYNSWGNGSGMRVSPVGWAFDDLETVLTEAKDSAAVSHNHPEGIKGAQAVASSVFLARTGASKSEIKNFIETEFDYDLNFSLDDLREHYEYEISCQKSVPQAIFCFLLSNNFEEAIRLAISIGGDSDTIACMSGSIAHAFYKDIPAGIKTEIFDRLHPDLLAVVKDFCQQYRCL